MCGIFYFLYIARLAIIFFKLASFSSSEMEGSFIKRPQGKSGHSTVFPLLFLTAFPDGTYRIACILKPEHLTFYLSASIAFLWE